MRKQKLFVSVNMASCRSSSRVLHSYFKHLCKNSIVKRQVHNTTRLQILNLKTWDQSLNHDTRNKQRWHIKSVNRQNLETYSYLKQMRKYSSDQTESRPSCSDPFSLVKTDVSVLCDSIRNDILSTVPALKAASDYHFDGEGKAFRPMIIFLTSRAVNSHNELPPKTILASQRKIAQIAEMIHVASLVHDDVIDAADIRRGKESVMKKWGQQKAIITGDYILSIASQALARIGNEDVVKILSQVLEDLVRGEFMQLGSKEDETERFNHYLKKSYKKTASLIANSCKAVAVLGQSDYSVEEIAYEYGKNIGIAFQLVDDLLDFISSEEMMGKPAADLKLGLATGPVLFAAQQFPELNALIMRRFSEPGDVDVARNLVAKSNGVYETKVLAEKHAMEAIRQISQLNPSTERDALIILTNKVLNRLK